LKSTGNLWAIGYDVTERADQVREEIISLGWDRSHLILEDVAVVVRHTDGTFALNRQPYPAIAFILGFTLAGFLAGLVMATPLSGAAIGTLLGGAHAAIVAGVGIDAQFIQDVEKLMKPGTSALFVLEDGGDMDVILHDIRGLEGTILKTNVDLSKARMIQSVLAAQSGGAISPGRG
jgi:uncharacterized membrane protein